MPKSTFIGLIILIAALLVASVPALLDPTAAQVEKGLTSVGVITPPSTSANDFTPKAKQGSKPAKSQLQLHGYDVQKGGDLRDTLAETDRQANVRGRLADGSQRILLPGEREASDLPPASTVDGVLLDIDGCPLLRPDTDVKLLLANPDTANLYAEKVGAADDPALCNALFKQRVADATAVTTSAPLGTTVQNDRNAIRRGDTSSMVVALAEIQLLSSFMSDKELQAALATLDGSAGSSSTSGSGSTAAATSATTTASK